MPEKPITCGDCGNVYDYQKTDVCPACGAGRLKPYGTVDSDG